MDRVLINPAIVSGIADAVREKKGSTGQIKVSELPDQIRSIEVGGVGENVKEVVEAISGVTSEEDVVIANGIAKGATDTPSEQTWNGERQTAGGSTIKDGVAYVKNIKGQSLKYNQKLRLKYGTQTINGVTFTPQGDGSVLVNGTATAEARCVIIGINSDASVWLFRGCPPNGSSSTYFFGTSAAFADTGGGRIRSFRGISNTYEYSIYVEAGVTITNLIFRPQLVNLTMMFGSGNEPTTPDEFAQRLGYASIDDLPYIPYTEGEVVSMQGKEIKSVGRNLWDEQWKAGVVNFDTGEFTPTYSYGMIVSSFIPVVPNKQICAIDHREGKTSFLNFLFYDKSLNYLGRTYCKFNIISFTIPSEAAYMRFRTDAQYGNTYLNDICISYSDIVDKTYTPYQQPDTFPLPISSILHEGQPLFPDGLNGIGDVKDEVDLARGKAVKRIGKYEFTGREYIAFYDIGSVVNTATIGENFVDWKAKTPLISVEMQYLGAFSSKAEVNAINSLGIGKYFNPASLSGFLYLNTNYASREALLSWLKERFDNGNPLTIFYPLAEPIEVTFEPCKAFYKAQNGGREEIVSDVFTAPVTAEIGYRGMSAEALMSSLSNIQNQ